MFVVLVGLSGQYDLSDHNLTDVKGFEAVWAGGREKGVIDILSNLKYRTPKG